MASCSATVVIKRFVEVKCPSRGQKNSCLESVDCKWRLQRNNSYYFQIQAQMNACDIEDVFWFERDIVIERDTFDSFFYPPLFFGLFGEYCQLNTV